jgi:hypothetical protein
MSACGAREGRVARVQVGEVGDLVGNQRTANAGMLRPSMHAGLEEGAVDDQLTAALEQVEQTRFALGPVERICLVHGHPRHPPTLGGQRVTGAGQGLLLDEKLLARSLPLLRRHNRWRVHGVPSSFHRFSGDVIVVIATSGSERSLVSGWNAIPFTAVRALSVMRCFFCRPPNDGSDKCDRLDRLAVPGYLGRPKLPFLPFRDSVVHRFPHRFP